MKTKFMLTVIYTHGNSKDIDFDTKEERKEFFKAIRDTECKFTFWEQDVLTEDDPEGGYYIGMPYPHDDLYNGIQDEPF